MNYLKYIGFLFVCDRYGSVQNYLEYIGFGPCEQKRLRDNFLEECTVSSDKSSDDSFPKYWLDSVRVRSLSHHSAGLQTNMAISPCTGQKLLVLPYGLKMTRAVGFIKLFSTQPVGLTLPPSPSEYCSSCGFYQTVLNTTSGVNFASQSKWKLFKLQVLSNCSEHNQWG